MRLYEAKPAAVLRIRIYKEANDAKYITICDCSQDEAISKFKTLIEKQNLSPFQSGKRINIEVREAIGSKNGKSKSIAFKGLTVEETYNLIIEYIKNNPMLNEKELRQYATEMKQICETYLLGQHTSKTFIIACQRIQDYFSTLDNENNQNYSPRPETGDAIDTLQP